MLIALALIVLLGIAFLALPSGAGLKSESGKRKWYMIVMGIRIPVPDRLVNLAVNWIRTMPAQPAKPPSPEVLKRAARKPHDRIQAPELFGLLRRAWGARRWFLKGVRLRVRRFDLTVASPDPAWTGMAYGFACAVQAMLPSRWPIWLGVDFDRTSPLLAYHVEVTTVPMYMMVGALRILLKR